MWSCKSWCLLCKANTPDNVWFTLTGVTMPMQWLAGVAYRQPDNRRYKTFFYIVCRYAGSGHDIYTSTYWLKLCLQCYNVLTHFINNLDISYKIDVCEAMLNSIWRNMSSLSFINKILGHITTWNASKLIMPIHVFLIGLIMLHLLYACITW